MKKPVAFALVGLLALLALPGLEAVGAKSASMNIIYDVTTVVSFLLLVGYCGLVRKRDGWFLLLFSSVFVVNVGYLTLSVSSTLEQALMANRLSYLGSVCLPMAMLMIIMNVCRLKYRRWLPGALLGAAAAVFVIAASPGYLDIYYKEVSLTTVNGVSVLEKVYGPWHRVYFVYLISYFAATVGVLADAFGRRKPASFYQAAMLAAAVFMNMGVWLLEQLVKVDFELLSISYIVTELFLLGIHLMTQADSREEPAEEAQTAEEQPAEEDAGEQTPEELPEISAGEPGQDEFREKCEYFEAHLPSLTPTEKVIFGCYLSGKTTKEIMAELNIKENTLKYHNRNLYGKLGVSSRKQLMEIARALKAEGGAS